MSAPVLEFTYRIGSFSVTVSARAPFSDEAHPAGDSPDGDGSEAHDRSCRAMAPVIASWLVQAGESLRRDLLVSSARLLAEMVAAEHSAGGEGRP